MTENAWPRSLTKIQGALIAHHRDRRGLNHTDLVERVSALGVEMQRTTLINIEQGRRKAISVPEIYAFAYALQIPPILLLVPLGNVDEVEILRGKNVAPWVATRWVRGDGVLDAPIDGSIPQEGPLRDEFDALLHHGEVLMWHRFLDDVQHALVSLHHRQKEQGPDARVPADGPTLREQLDLKKWEVQSWRNRLREQNLIPPPIWPDVARLFPEIS